MRSFRQIISEQLPSDKLDKLTHNIPLSKKRLKKLAGDYSAFEDFDFDSWQSYPFPSNSSKIVIHEIQYLIGLQEFRSQWEKDMMMHDTKVIEAFKNYLEKHELEVDLEPIKELQNQSDPIILSLKRFYNRPRPKDLAKKLGLDFSFFSLKTAETPSYPSGHATQGRLVAKLIADEVPFKHRADIIRIGEDMGEGRMIAGAHYPTDTNFGHLLADELYRLAKEPKKSELTLEILDFELTEGRIFDKIKGGIVKIKAVWSQLKRYISGAFRKVKNLLPFQTVVFTIPSLAKEEIDFMSLEKTKDGKVTLNENALGAIKGNYNEALTVQYLYDLPWSSVEIDLNEESPGGRGWGGGKKYSEHKRDVDAAVTDWDTQLKNKITNYKAAVDVIQKGSKDMVIYLNKTAGSNKAKIKGGWVDNLAVQKGVNFKADIRVATQRADSTAIVTGYSLKLYGNKSVGLTNNTARSLAFRLGGSVAQAKVDVAENSDPELLKMIDTVRRISKEYKDAKDDPERAHMSKRGGELYQARQDARSPLNKRFATIVYEAIKSVPHDVFVANLLHLLGFDDKETKMLLSVITKAGKREIIAKHPDLDLSKIELVHTVGTVSIRVVGPNGKTIVSFGTKEGERKAITGKVSFAGIEPEDLEGIGSFNQE